MAVLREMELACEAGDGDRAALLFLRDQVGSPPEVVEGYRGSPLWAKFVEVAPTLARESLVVNTLGWSPSSLNGWRGPATMLLGSETKGELRDAALRLCNAIAGCRLSILEGQGHGAMLTAPDLFVTRVLEAAGLRPQSHQA
jgi:pimeloyl-ACP methyl ester carboxylesterase